MPVTMGGMASGIDTDKIINKLVEVEARPIRQWEADKKIYNGKKEALNILKSFLLRLSDAAKQLYGFRASYNDKKAISSNPDIIKASASKYAKSGTKNIKVLELASTHKIASDPIIKDKTFPAAKIKIEINGESEIIKFKGGKLKSLQDKIDEVASDLVTTSYIKTTDNDYILTIESKIQGKKGEIKLTGDKEFLKEIGLIKGEKWEEKQKVGLIFDRKYFTSYIGIEKIAKQNGSLGVGKGGKSIAIKSVLWQEYVLPMEVSVKKETILELDIVYKAPIIEEEALPFSMEIGPEERIIIKGIELKSYNVTRIRPLEKRKKKKEIINVFGIGVVSTEKGERVEKIYNIGKKAKGRQEVSLGKDFAGKDISKVIFYCNEGECIFSNAKIITPLKGKGILIPKNLITKASDAKLKVDGIEIVRNRNNNLDDVVKGVSIDLRKKSKDPISVTIEPDIEKAIMVIKKFVEEYNKYLDYNRELTKAEKVDKPGEFKKAQFRSGLFVGDMTIARIENALKTAASGAYPNIADKPIKILPQIGISTGAINAEWESIKEGKLVIDEDKLYNIILDNPEGVKEFFGSDSDGDNRIDNGFAYRIENILKPYVRSGKNIIAAKIDLELNAIKRADDRIVRHQEHLKKYEDKLRRKFATMEKAISGAKMQGNWMKTQMKGLPSTSKGKGK